MNSSDQIKEVSCEAIGGGCFWSEFWASYEPLALAIGSDAFRNGALVLAAIATLVIAIWRANTADQDKKTAQKQSDTSEAGLNIDRFQRGSAMLGDGRISVRQAGIIMLSELAQQNMSEYFDPVQKVLCSLIRERSAEQRKDFDERIRESANELYREYREDFNNVDEKSYSDPEAIKSQLTEHYNERARGLEEIEFFEEISFENETAIHELSRLNGALLKLNRDDPAYRKHGKILIENANFKGAKLSALCFRGMEIRNSDFSYAIMVNTDLTDCMFPGSNFDHAMMINAEMGSSKEQNHSFRLRFFEVKNLTYSQLSKAKNVDSDFLEELRLKELQEKDQKETDSISASESPDN